jgi:Mn-containing catalase
MPQLKELLVEQLQDLLHAENLLTGALPKMAEAAHHPKLKEAFQKHLAQTQEHVERLEQVFEMLGEEVQPTPCKAMMGLVEEGKETIEKGSEKEPIASDLALIAAAQRVEHYEIASYGTARTLARQLGENDAARLLTHTLGEEETSDFLLTMIADPLIQQAAIEDGGNHVNLENGDRRMPPKTAKKTEKSEKIASRAH